LIYFIFSHYKFFRTIKEKAQTVELIITKENEDEHLVITL